MRLARKTKQVLILVMFLCLLISNTFSIFDVTLLADDSKDVKNHSKVIGKETKVVKELVEERTENSNSFLMSDGTIRTDICTNNIRYMENGELVDYDNNLVCLSYDDEKLLHKFGDEKIEDYVAVNKSGDSKQFFPKSPVNSDVILTKDNFKLGFSLNIGETFTYSISDKKIIYNSENTKIEYCSNTNGVKERIIYNSKPSSNIITFKVSLTNIKLEEKKLSDSINILDKDSGKKIGYLTTPTIEDSDGIVRYKEIEYQVREKQGETYIDLIIDSSYLNNAKYPVVVDPTAVWFSNGLSTAVVNSSPYTSGLNLHSSILYVQNQCNSSNSIQRVYLDTSNVVKGSKYMQGPADFIGKEIKSATLSICEESPKFTTGTVEVYQPTESWDASTVTWNNQPLIGDDLITSCVFTGVNQTRHNMDITQWVQKIADGKIKDTGLVFVAREQGTGDSFGGPELSGTGYMWISITYRCDNEITKLNYVNMTETSYCHEYDNTLSNQIETGFIPNGLTSINDGISTYGILPGGSLTYVSPNIYPYSTIVTFATYNSNTHSNGVYGSGFVIGPNVIVTAAHCVVNSEGWVKNMRVISQYGTSSSTVYKVKEIYCLSKYIDCIEKGNVNKIRYDWAVVIVDGNIGEKTGWLGFETSDSLYDSDITVAGYTVYEQSGYSGWNLFKDSGKITYAGNEEINYNANTQGGQSGSPVLNASNIVCGVHTAGYRTDETTYISNAGARITPLNFSLFREKKSQGIEIYK